METKPKRNCLGLLQGGTAGSVLTFWGNSESELQLAALRPLQSRRRHCSQSWLCLEYARGLDKLRDCNNLALVCVSANTGTKKQNSGSSSQGRLTGTLVEPWTGSGIGTQLGWNCDGNVGLGWALKILREYSSWQTSQGTTERPQMWTINVIVNS